MDKEELDLTCPCMPQCPNYGNCRVCIAEHAKYYTMPKCVRMMCEDMKKNHIHAKNPHAKGTLTERIADFYAKNPSEHLRTVAEALKITDWQLLDAHPSALPVPVSDFSEVYDKLKTLPKVLLHIDTGSVVLQLETQLPDAMKMRDTVIVKRSDGDMALTSLLFPTSFYAMFLVRESLYGKESLSVAIVGEDEKIALSIYMRRTLDGVIDSPSREVFEALWSKYSEK